MDLKELFSSASKYMVLRTLSQRRTPVHLRELAELSKVGLRSAQLAVAALVKAHVITAYQEANRKYFALNAGSRFVPVLREFFTAEEMRKLEDRAVHYQNAEAILYQVQQIRMMSWQSSGSEKS